MFIELYPYTLLYRGHFLRERSAFRAGLSVAHTYCGFVITSNVYPPKLVRSNAVYHIAQKFNGENFDEWGMLKSLTSKTLMNLVHHPCINGAIANKVSKCKTLVAKLLLNC